MRYFFAAWLTVSTLCSAAFADCDISHVHLEGAWGKARFDVEIVDTPESRATGLMHRTDLPRFGGMLFVFQNEHVAQFWMKNTLIPLDILYFDRNGQLINIWKDAQPGELVGEPSAGKALFVLEINGGLSDLLGIDVKTQMVHPTIQGVEKTLDCR